MLDAAIKALSQMFSPPFRAVLLKSVGLALVLIVLIGIGLQRLLIWLATYGTDWAESMLGTSAHTPLAVLAWIVSIAVESRHHRRIDFPDAGGDRAGGDLFRRRHRARSGTHVLSRRSGRRRRRRRCARCWKACRTRFVLGPGLSRRGAVPALRRLRRRHLFPGHGLSARPRIFRAGGDAPSVRRRSQTAAQDAPAARFSSPACSSPPSSRYRSSISPRRCSPWPSWCTCTSG